MMALQAEVFSDIPQHQPSEDSTPDLQFSKWTLQTHNRGNSFRDAHEFSCYRAAEKTEVDTRPTP